MSPVHATPKTNISSRTGFQMSEVDSSQPTSPDDAEPAATATTADEKQWDRKFVVTCHSLAQKKELADRAEKAGLSLSRFALNKALASEPEIAELRSLVKQAVADRNRYREDLALARRRAERERLGAQQQIRNLENRLTVLLAEQELLLKTLGREPDEGRLMTILDAQVVNMIAASKAGGQPLPVLDREIVQRLDKLDDPAFTSTLIDRLERLAGIGMIERVLVYGRKASVWRGEL